MNINSKIIKLFVSSFLILSGSSAIVNSAQAQTRYLPTSNELQLALDQANQSYRTIAGEYKDCTDMALSVAQMIATNANAELQIKGSGNGVAATARLGTGSEIGLTIDNGFVFSTHFSLLPNFGGPSLISRAYSQITQSEKWSLVRSCSNIVSATVENKLSQTKEFGNDLYQQSTHGLENVYGYLPSMPDTSTISNHWKSLKPF